VLHTRDANAQQPIAPMGLDNCRSISLCNKLHLVLVQGLNTHARRALHGLVITKLSKMYRPRNHSPLCLDTAIPRGGGGSSLLKPSTFHKNAPKRSQPFFFTKQAPGFPREKSQTFLLGSFKSASVSNLVSLQGTSAGTAVPCIFILAFVFVSQQARPFPFPLHLYIAYDTAGMQS